jgi:hypothetical protein
MKHMNLSFFRRSSGQKPIEVVGPFPEIEDELLAPHR